MPAGPFVSIGTTTGLTFTDTGVTNAQTYFYVVAALNAGGSGPNSSAVSATPPSVPCPLFSKSSRVSASVGSRATMSSTKWQWAHEDLGEDTEWENLGGEIIGNDSTMTVFDPTAGAAYIYQVVSF